MPANNFSAFLCSNIPTRFCRFFSCYLGGASVISLVIVMTLVLLPMRVMGWLNPESARDNSAFDTYLILSSALARKLV